MANLKKLLVEMESLLRAYTPKLFQTKLIFLKTKEITNEGKYIYFLIFGGDYNRKRKHRQKFEEI